MATKKPSLKDYKFNENDPAVELTMEAMEISRKQAIKTLKELNYMVHHPKTKKKRKKQVA
jgi:NACalpha-BTF3-like transcription factor